MTERARILKFEPEAPPSQKTPSGYAAVPREVTRKTDLSSGAHRVLVGLLGLCYGDDRHCRASIRQIRAASGVSERTIKRALAELLRLKLIGRHHKLDRPGGVMTTAILCHPKEFGLSNEPTINWRIKSPLTTVRTRGQVGPTSGQVGPTSGQVGTPRLTDFQQTLNLGGKADLPPIVAAPPPDPPPSNPPPVWDSRQEEVVALATQRWGASNGDCMIGDLLRAYPVELVRAAIDRHWDKVGPGIRPALLRATCQGMLADGWTPGQPAPGRSGGSVPYKPEGPVPPPVAPMTEEEIAALKDAGERLMDEHRERVRNGRRQKQED